MRLVPNWRSCWKWLSIQLVLVGGALQGAILAWPEAKDWIGDKASHYVGLLILAGVGLGRLKDQSKEPK